MASNWRWFLRLARIVASGVVFAIVVVEIQLALGFRLPIHRSSASRGPPSGSIVAALAFAAYSIWTTTTGAWASVGIAAFVVAVMPFNALLEPSPPPIPVDFWRGGGTLRIERTMTVERSYPVVLVLNGPKDIGGKTPAPTTGGSGPVAADGESVVARLSGEPRSAFAIVPDKDEPKPLSVTGDYALGIGDVTPKQEGPQRLLLELDTRRKRRQARRRRAISIGISSSITVQPPTWYEAARRWLIGLVSGS